jgi:hypothetical protein
MAEISRDTTAILDRLKREGSLTRNGGEGKNSIKQININLDKFGVMFQGIQNELANLNKTFGQMLSANPGTFQGPLPQANTVASTVEPPTVQFDEEQLRALGLDEETIKLQKESATLNIKNNLEDEKLRAETERQRKEDVADKRRKERTEKTKDYLKNKTITGQVLTNPLSFFTKLLKGAAIGFVGFNVVRGIVDQWTGGAFTEFVEGIDYKAIGEGIKTFASVFTNNGWAGFTAALVAWSAIDFGVPLALTMTGEMMRTSMLAKALNKGVEGGITSSKGFLSTVTSVKGMAFTALGVGIAVGGAKLADYVRKQVSGMTDEQIANEKFTKDWGDVVDVGSMALAGASIGGMFGMKGALVGAILGFAFGVGKKAYDYINASAEEKIGFDMMGEDLARENAKTAKLMLAQHADGTRELTEVQLKALRKQAEGPSRDLIVATNNEIGDQRNNLNEELQAIQNRNITQEMEYTSGGLGGGSARLVDITDATKLMELENQRDADLAAKRAEIAKVEETVQNRVAAGYATLEELEYQTRDTVGQKVGSFLGMVQSDDILEANTRDAENQRLSLIDFFTRSTEDDYLNDKQVTGMMKLVEDGAMTKGQMINIIKNGDVNQFVDASDKSSTVNKRTLFTGGDMAPMPN